MNAFVPKEELITYWLLNFSRLIDIFMKTTVSAEIKVLSYLFPIDLELVGE